MGCCTCDRPGRMWWTDAVVMCGAFLFAILIETGNVAAPKEQIFYLDDEDIANPNRPDTVPVSALAVIGFVVGPILLILADVFDQYVLRGCNAVEEEESQGGSPRALPPSDDGEDKEGRTETVGALLRRLRTKLAVYFFGMAITVILTDSVKLMVGRLRPDFLDRCDPDPSKVLPPQTTPAYYDGSLCLGDPAVIEEGRKAFPSGHASFSAYTMLFVVFYYHNRFWRPQLGTRLVPFLVQFLALCCTLMVGSSRVPDYKHRISDVIAGWVVGLVVALFIFRAFFGGFRSYPPFRDLGVEGRPRSPADCGLEAGAGGIYASSSSALVSSTSGVYSKGGSTPLTDSAANATSSFSGARAPYASVVLGSGAGSGVGSGGGDP